MYFLTKIIIEKNEQSISMSKILGYKNSEIRAVYLRSTTIVTVVLLIVCLPVMLIAIGKIYYVMLLHMMSGWMPLELDTSLMYTAFALGLGSYVIVALVEMARIRRIPMDIALKNVE